MGKRMKAPCIEGVATHDDPEPCVGVRKGMGEASVGAHVGRAIEPRNDQFGALTLLVGRKATPAAALARVAVGLRAVEEPVHAWNLHAREPGGPMLARLVDHRAGRSGKAEAVRLG